jgi:4-amino-4-deoxy-L-arabinose transferase-like glycosyltransferase
MDDHVKKYYMSKYFPWLAMGIILVLTAALRFSMLQIPLERDEGEYAYMGQLLLQGIPPYLHAYSMKLPGMCAIYALIMGIFGQSIFAIHLGLLIFNGIAIILVFLLTRYLADEIVGVIAALVYALMSVSPSVWGIIAHATQFIVPFALGGLLLLLKAIDKRKTWMLIASGLLLGSAFLVKQHAVFFVLFAILYYFSRMARKPVAKIEMFYNISLLAGSAVIPFLTVCGLFYWVGLFPTFWFWTFTYSSQYVSVVPISMAMETFRNVWMYFSYPWRLIWAVSGVGLSSIFWNEKIRAYWDFWLGFSVFSFFSICPGFYFTPHYFVTLLPAVAMLSGIAVSASMMYLSQRFSPYLKTLPVIFIIIALVLPAWQQKRFFSANPVDVSRMIYGKENPFPEMLAVGEYIKNHSLKSDIIAVLGSEPQIYFYANRKSATGYIYMYGLMEPHIYAYQMQKEMIREIESVKPRYIVFVNAKLSWSPEPDSNMYIFHWSKKYLDDYYLLRGVINSMSDLKIRTDVNSRDIRHGFNQTMSIFERKQR